MLTVWEINLISCLQSPQESSRYRQQRVCYVSYLWPPLNDSVLAVFDCFPILFARVRAFTTPLQK